MGESPKLGVAYLGSLYRGAVAVPLLARRDRNRTGFPKLRGKVAFLSPIKRNASSR
jgi:hypothetical protein